MLTLESAKTLIDLGLIYSLPTMGLWISNKVLNKYDLTLEGSFCVGASSAAYMAFLNISPFLAFLAAMLSGLLTGLTVFLLHHYLAIEVLMGGIVLNTAFFSLALLMAGAHYTLPPMHLLFNSSFYLHNIWCVSFVLLLLVISIVGVIQWLLSTEFGLVWQSVGENPQLITQLGKSVPLYTAFSLSVSNMLSALSGFLFVHYLGFFSIWSNVGVIVIGLTGLLIAKIIKNTFGYHVLLGALCYQSIIALTLEIDISPEWHKIIGALFTVILMALVRRISND